MLLGRWQPARARGLAAAVAAVALVLTLTIWHRFDSTALGLQFVESHAWAPSLGMSYHLGVDGLGVLMLVLTAIVVLMSLAASWANPKQGPVYFALVLLLEAGLFGTFTALNFVHWFLFWELSLIPAFFLVRLWGGKNSAALRPSFFSTPWLAASLCCSPSWPSFWPQEASISSSSPASPAADSSQPHSPNTCTAATAR